MRTDIITDRRLVRLPKASGLGTGKMRAQVGDIITWQYPHEPGIYTGRMVSRLVWAPGDADNAARRNWIVVIQLASDLSHGYERWIDPRWVLRCQDTRGLAEWLAWFAGPDFPTGDDARVLAEHGSMSAGVVRFANGPIDIAAHGRQVLAERRERIASAASAV